MPLVGKTHHQKHSWLYIKANPTVRVLTLKRQFSGSLSLSVSLSLSLVSGWKDATQNVSFQSDLEGSDGDDCAGCIFRVNSVVRM